MGRMLGLTWRGWLLRWQEMQEQIQQQNYAITEGMDELQLGGKERLGISVN
jgi:hypothetical protein